MKKLLASLTLVLLIIASAAPLTAQEQEHTVRARVQAHPGGPVVEDIEMGVHEVPVDPKTVAAGEAQLEGRRARPRPGNRGSADCLSDPLPVHV